MATIISTKTSGVGGLEVSGDASGILQLASNNGTTAVTVDASQNVGIGTSTMTSKFNVAGGITIGDYQNIGATSNSTGISLTGGSVTNNGGQINLRGGSFGTANAIEFIQGGTEQGRFDTGGVFKFNSGYGSVATAYGCRAWVNFNGTGTVAIRASGNVSSITDLGNGYYQVNFTNAMPDVNYSVAGAGQYDTGGVNADVPPVGIRRTTNVMQTTNVKISISGGIDCVVVCVNVFR